MVTVTIGDTIMIGQAIAALLNQDKKRLSRLLGLDL